MAQIQVPQETLEQLRDEIRALHEEQERTNRLIEHDHPNGGTTAAVEENEVHDQPPAAPPPPRAPVRRKKHRLRNYLIAGGILIVVIIAVLWWLNSRHYESTDDAQVQGHISGIASRIAGTVVSVFVEEDQQVTPGEVVVQLDPKDYQIAVEQARARLTQAEAQVQAAQPNVPVTQVTNQTSIANAQSDVASAQAGIAAAQRDYEAAMARIQEAEANSAKAQADVDRYQPLAAKDEIPQQQFDQVKANAKALAATVEAQKASAQAALQQVSQRQAQLRQAQEGLQQAQKNAPQQLQIRRANVATSRSNIQVAQAELDQAQLNLSYCKIVTPVAGIVAQRTAEPGEHVAPGQQVITVAENSNLWVNGNFKETQLQRIRPGQSVTIHVDALDKDFEGTVESMPAATGAITSLLPPENATGNYVKVVQRLPVRIAFKKGQDGLDRLRPGMSVEPKIRVD